MIVKFFTHGTGGSKGVFDYLLNDKEQPDGKRLGAEVLRGDIDNQALLIDSLDFKQKYTSGCLSFTESADEVTAEQKNALMDGFEETLRAGLEVDRVSVSWIEHRDKGRLELNFVFADVDLEYGRAFSPISTTKTNAGSTHGKTCKISSMALLTPTTQPTSD